MCTRKHVHGLIQKSVAERQWNILKINNNNNNNNNNGIKEWQLREMVYF